MNLSDIKDPTITVQGVCAACDGTGLTEHVVHWCRACTTRFSEANLRTAESALPCGHSWNELQERQLPCGVCGGEDGGRVTIAVALSELTAAVPAQEVKPDSGDLLEAVRTRLSDLRIKLEHDDMGTPEVKRRLDAILRVARGDPAAHSGSAAVARLSEE